MLYLDSNRQQEAKDVFSQAVAQEPDNSDAHFGLGLALGAQQNDQAAIEEYKTAARLDTQATGINYNLGVSYARLKMYDDAVAAFLKEQKQSGDNEQLETALAQAYQANGLTQKAEAARTKAAQLKAAQ